MVVVKAERRLVADGLVGANALAVGVSSALVGAFRVERAVAQERSRTLIALLLQALRAHGSKEAMCGERDVSSTCGRGRSALRAQTPGHTRGAWASLHGSTSS